MGSCETIASVRRDGKNLCSWLVTSCLPPYYTSASGFCQSSLDSSSRNYSNFPEWRVFFFFFVLTLKSNFKAIKSEVTVGTQCSCAAVTIWLLKRTGPGESLDRCSSCSQSLWAHWWSKEPQVHHFLPLLLVDLCHLSWTEKKKPRKLGEIHND